MNVVANHSFQVAIMCPSTGRTIVAPVVTECFKVRAKTEAIKLARKAADKGHAVRVWDMSDIGGESVFSVGLL